MPSSSSRGITAQKSKDVWDRVNVAKGSFYNCFESKEHFGAEAFRHFAGQFIAQLDAQLGNPKEDVLSVLKKCFKQMIRCFEGVNQACGCLVGNLGAELGHRSDMKENSVYHLSMSSELSSEYAMGG